MFFFLTQLVDSSKLYLEKKETLYNVNQEEGKTRQEKDEGSAAVHPLSVRLASAAVHPISVRLADDGVVVVIDDCDNC